MWFSRSFWKWVSLKQYCTSATTSYFVKFFLKRWWLSKKNLKVKVKFMSAFVFYLWLHLRQAFRTVTNFLYNTSLSRNTRSRTLGQVFNHSSWKLMQVNSTCSKTLKLPNVCKMLVKRVKQGTLYGVIFQSLSKQFQSNVSQPNNNRIFYRSSHLHF